MLTICRSITPEALSVYSAAEVLAVNQDELMIPGIRLRQDQHLSTETWTRQLKGSIDSGPLCAIMLFNRANVTQEVSLEWEELEVLGERWRGMRLGAVRDLWESKAIGFLEKGITTKLSPHSTQLLRVTRLK